MRGDFTLYLSGALSVQSVRFWFFFVRESFLIVSLYSHLLDFRFKCRRLKYRIWICFLAAFILVFFCWKKIEIKKTEIKKKTGNLERSRSKRVWQLFSYIKGIQAMSEVPPVLCILFVNLFCLHLLWFRAYMGVWKWRLRHIFFPDCFISFTCLLRLRQWPP